MLFSSTALHHHHFRQERIKIFSYGKTVFFQKVSFSPLPQLYHFIKNSPPVALHIFHCIKMNILGDDGRSLLKNIFSYKQEEQQTREPWKPSRLLKKHSLIYLRRRKSRFSCKQFCCRFHPEKKGWYLIYVNVFIIWINVNFIQIVWNRWKTMGYQHQSFCHLFSPKVTHRSVRFFLSMFLTPFSRKKCRDDFFAFFCRWIRNEWMDGKRQARHTQTAVEEKTHLKRKRFNT